VSERLFCILGELYIRAKEIFLAIGIWSGVICGSSCVNHRLLLQKASILF